ncbi:MAG: glycerol-3-phosphate 1-O-acyltransferase PlsY [Firmicutes bacterium]|nr:glycerol-3-phosphate 1-O-acyltransferase PlsY [Bacillota bacterium]
MSVRLLCLLIGYAFGMIQSAFIVGRMRGIDIREHGSGNAGTTNAMRVMGTKDGLLVFFMDTFKSFFALLAVQALFGARYPELIYLLKIYALAGCVLGHDFPFYMKFRGGKGVAVIAGFVFFSFHWTFLPAAIALFFIPFLLTHYVSLGSLILYLGCFVLLVIEGQLGLYAPAPQGVLTEMYVIMALLTALAYYRHRANIRRLLQGNERKTYIFRKNNPK